MRHAGDAYLKYAVSAYLFAIMPEGREAALHTARREIVCNKALYLGAVSVGLPAFMRVKPFLPRVWQPTSPPRSETERPTNTDRNDTNATDPVEGSSKPKKGKRKKQQDEQGIQWIGDKVGVSFAKRYFSLFIVYISDSSRRRGSHNRGSISLWRSRSRS